MMNDEMNIHDEFEDWLKQSADKHKMYPSDKLWRNINEQLHEQPNWPALTFGAILTLALITATLIFLHPNKDLFSVPNYAYSFTSKSSVESAANQPSAITPIVRQTKVKEPVYSFNKSFRAYEESSYSQPIALQQVEDYELPALTNQSQLKANSIANNRATEKLIEKSAAIVLNTSISLQTAEADDNLALAATSTTSKLEDTTTIGEQKLQHANENAKIVQLPQAKKKRWYVEVYGGSNISYRRLNESAKDGYHTAYSQPSASDRENLNSIVNQRPSVGVNAGAAFVYSVSDRVRLKAGLQLNFRQYNIDAFKSKYDRSVLLLNNGYYYPDSVVTFSAISNEQGKATVLGNKYYQIGIPIGIEWTAVQLRNVNFNLAANVQPTYQINSNNYLLTSDYKNYVQAPGLLRRMNINAGVEATANFNAGRLQWQVGPQILYQTLPTQKANYSIHEHLIDYGIRVGIIKRL